MYRLKITTQNFLSALYAILFLGSVIFFALSALAQENGLKPNGEYCFASSECSSGYCDGTTETCQVSGGSGDGRGDTTACQNAPDPDACICELQPDYAWNFNTGTCVDTSSGVGGVPPNPGTVGGVPPNPGTVGGGTIKLLNPLQSKSITEFLLKIIDVILIFALPIIILFIMYAGFLFVTAKGNESQVTTAKSALTWAVVGGVIVLGAKLIITLIEGTIKAF